MNPGFWIVVAAAPAQQPVAQAISLFLQRTLKDAYIKPVEIPAPESLSVLATDDQLHFLPDTQMTDLALAGWFKREDDCTFALFDPRKPEAKRILAVTPDCPASYTISFSPDHK